jgi:hypothetical protein
MILGVLCLTSLPEDYRDAGVYNGTWRAVARMVYGVLLVFVEVLFIRLANKIESNLTIEIGGAVAAKDKVMPSQIAPEDGVVDKKVMTTNKPPSPITTTSCKTTEQSKIISMIHKTTAIVAVAILYVIYDVYKTYGKYAHIIDPFCSQKDLFVRLQAVMQIFCFWAIIIVFPVKRMDNSKSVRGSTTTKSGKKSGGKGGPSSVMSIVAVDSK